MHQSACFQRIVKDFCRLFVLKITTRYPVSLWYFFFMSIVCQFSCFIPTKQTQNITLSNIVASSCIVHMFIQYSMTISVQLIATIVLYLVNESLLSISSARYKICGESFQNGQPVWFEFGKDENILLQCLDDHHSYSHITNVYKKLFSGFCPIYNSMKSTK